MVSAPKGKAAAGRSRAATIQQPTTSLSPAPQQVEGHPQSPAPPSSSKDGIKTRQKRILPTRSRRGGPGVGSCDTDQMILETMRRKFENEPLIPASTPFLLTTKLALVASTSSSTDQPRAQLNTLAYSRYFDRPEVRAAYRAQQLIQTPEFTELSQDAHVGSRFRPRGSEDEAVDTSDAAYEKRHRKYETFEKRQRLREKEKLKHEHYKLKERIDQLRGMDTSAFLTIPASEFVQARSDNQPPTEQMDVAAGDTSYLHGAAAYHEGERRRKEMLEVALSLEQRYRTLLPPDRRWMEKKNTEKLASHDISMDTSMDTAEDVEEVEIAEDGEEEVDAENPVKEELLDEEGVEDDGESEIDFEEIERRKSKQLKLRIKLTPRMLASKHESKPPPTRGGGKQITLSPFFKHPSGGKGPFISSPLRSVSYSTPLPEKTSKHGRYSFDTTDTDTLLSVPSAKRQRTNASASVKSRVTKISNGADAGGSISSAELGSKQEPATCVLMVAAIRQSSAPTARKTQRHVTAFGARVPQEIEEMRDFEIPDWVLAPAASATASEDGDRGSYDNWFNEAHDAPSEDGGSASVVITDPET